MIRIEVSAADLGRMGKPLTREHGKIFGFRNVRGRAAAFASILSAALTAFGAARCICMTKKNG
jgi:hypothetical protein